MNLAQTRRVIVTGMIGNVLEWYDFAVYGFFAAAIGQEFFPHQDRVAQLISAFGIFALGYLMRPLGGAVTGHIGDRFGRRAALTFSIAAMTIPTFLIGLLPGYGTLGLLAPIALTILRMVQGLSVGGEYTSSMVFVVEQAPDGRRGLMGALTACGAIAGILLGSAVGAAFSANMSAAALQAWGWRIPFVLGLVVGVGGYVLRRQMPETIATPRRERAPIVETLHDHWRAVLGFASLSVFMAVGFYVNFVYLVSWLQSADHFAPARALEINTFSMAILMVMTAVSGLLADRFGRKPLLVLATMLGFIGALPLFWLLNHPSIWLAQLGQLGLALIVGLYAGTLPAILVEGAPVRVRCTAVALGYNVSLGVLGGLTPLVASWLVARTGAEIAPGFLMMAAAAVSFATIRRLPETYRTPFAGITSKAAAAYASALLGSAARHPPLSAEAADL